MANTVRGNNSLTCIRFAINRLHLAYQLAQTDHRGQAHRLIEEAVSHALDAKRFLEVTAAEAQAAAETADQFKCERCSKALADCSCEGQEPACHCGKPAIIGFVMGSPRCLACFDKEQDNRRAERRKRVTLPASGKGSGR